MIKIEDATQTLYKSLTLYGKPKWLAAIGYKQVADQKPSIIVYTVTNRAIPVIAGQWQGFDVVVKRGGVTKPLQSEQEQKAENQVEKAER